MLMITYDCTIMGISKAEVKRTGYF